MNVDEALKTLGLRGPWQILYYSVLCLGCYFPGAWHIVSIVWIGHKPPHHCKIPKNSSLDDWIPREKNDKLSSCSMYANFTMSNVTTRCVDGWEYDESFSGPTIVTKWNLVCDRGYMADSAQTIMTFGVLSGSLIFTKLSDSFGRKPILVFSQLSLSALGALTVLPNKLHYYYALQFLKGTFHQGVVLCTLVMLCEMFSSKDRALIAIGGSAVWGLGTSLLPFIAYFVRNWVVFELIISLYGFLFIPLFWWLPETVPWLYANNKIEKAEKTLLRAAKMNKITLRRPILMPYQKADINVSIIDMKSDNKFNFSSDVLTHKDGIEKHSLCFSLMKIFSKRKNAHNNSLSVKYSMMDLFSNKMLIKHLILSILFGFVDNMVYYGLTLSSTKLSGNHYRNGFVNAVLEVPACILTYVAVNRFGMKQPIVVTHVVAGLSLLSCIPINHCIVNQDAKMTTISVMNNIGKFGITGAYAIVFFYVAELFPTNLRNQAVGICLFFTRLGTIVASYASFLVERYPDLLPLIFGILSISVAILVKFLPETHNKPLPETIDDVNNLYKKTEMNAEMKNNLESDHKNIEQF